MRHIQGNLEEIDMGNPIKESHNSPDKLVFMVQTCISALFRDFRTSWIFNKTSQYRVKGARWLATNLPLDGLVMQVDSSRQDKILTRQVSRSYVSRGTWATFLARCLSKTLCFGKMILQRVTVSFSCTIVFWNFLLHWFWTPSSLTRLCDSAHDSRTALRMPSVPVSSTHSLPSTAAQGPHKIFWASWPATAVQLAAPHHPHLCLAAETPFWGRFWSLSR